MIRQGVNRNKNYDYGKCHVCGEQVKEKRINQDFWLEGKLIVVESVPAGVCPLCDEKIVKADVGRQLATSDPKPEALAQTKNDDRARRSIR